MPRTPWRRRIGTDSPRPAGRGRWAGRLRGSRVARRVLRVRHRGQAEPYRGGAWRPGRHDSRTAAATIAAIPPAVLPPGPEPVAELAGQPVAVAAAPSLLPGEPTLPRRVWFLLVNGCTLTSLSLGVLAILLAMRGEVRNAAFCLIACVVFDGLDGMLARRLGVASPFGSQMDSLADLCAFGIAAPVVVYASIAPERSSGAGDAVGSIAGSVPASAAAAACALVAGCAAVRLARFNISPKDSRFFSGVPTTTTAAVLAVAVLIDPLPPAAVLAGVALLAFAMVSSFPYATLARLLRLPPWLWLVPAAAALVDPRLTFVAMVAAYLVSGPVLWLHQRRAAAPA